VSLSDSHESPSPVDLPVDLMSAESTHHIIGNMLALLSALLSSIYMILLKVHIGSESRINMQFLFGCVGLINLVFNWPFGVLLHFIGMERFELPGSKRAVSDILINVRRYVTSLAIHTSLHFQMAITVSCDFIYAIAMMKTTPLLAIVGSSLMIPFAVIGDIFLHNPMNGQIIMGTILILLGFVIISVEGLFKSPV